MIGALLLWFSLSLGMQEIPVNNFDLKAPVYTELGVHAENEVIDLYGIYKTEIDGFDLVSVQDPFRIGAKVKYEGISIAMEYQFVQPLKNCNALDTNGYTKFEVTLSSKKD